MEENPSQVTAPGPVESPVLPQAPSMAESIHSSVFIALYFIVLAHFLYYDGLVLYVFPQMAERVSISEASQHRFVLLEGKVLTDIKRPADDPRGGRVYSRFLMADGTGVADVRFGLPWMGRPYGNAKVLGTVQKPGLFALNFGTGARMQQPYAVAINAVSVSGMVPWASIILMAISLVALGWLSFLTKAMFVLRR